jgi:hypothetical protein
MSNPLTPEELSELIPSRSSILKKVPLETRRLLNRAIIYRNPVTYEGIYNKFALDELGVSYTAFYYYARRIHLAITASELSKLRDDPHELISAAVAHTTLDVAAEPILAPKHLANVARAYHDVERARAARIKANLATRSEEHWKEREATRHQNRLELKAVDLSNRLTIEDRRAHHKKELLELKAYLAATKPPLPPSERAGVRVGIQDGSRSEHAPSLPITNSSLQIPPDRPESRDRSAGPVTPATSTLSPRYGRHPDGRPRTRQEFLAILRPQIYEIYGMDPPKERRRQNEPRAPASGPNSNISEPPRSEPTPQGVAELPSKRENRASPRNAPKPPVSPLKSQISDYPSIRLRTDTG